MSQASPTLFIDDGGRDNAPLRLPVVFLHSAGGNSGHFAKQLSHLRKERRALAVDLPGHGKSPKPSDTTHDHGFAIPEIAIAVERALSEPGSPHALDRFVLVGHSWGGAVALAMAGRAPGRVAGLLLLDPPADGHLMPAAESGALMKALRENYDLELETYWSSLLHESTPEVRERLMFEIKAAPHDVVIGTMTSIFAFDPVPSLKRYRGIRKSLYTRLNDNPSAYHRVVDDLPSERVHGTGHWLHLDKPEEVNAAIDSFLLDVDPH